MNIGNKRGFRFKSSWISNKMPEMSTFSVQAETAADTLLGPHLLPPRLTEAVYHNFHPKRPSRAAARRGSIYGPYIRMLHHILFLQFDHFLNSVFLAQLLGPGGPTAWPAPYPDLYFYIWRHLTSTVCATAVTEFQKVKQWSRVYLRWFVRNPEFSSESGNLCLEVQHPALTLKVVIWEFSVTVRWQ
jgi:hypothetical protein